MRHVIFSLNEYVMLRYEQNAGQTFFGDDPGSFEVVLVGDQQERLVDEWLAVSTDRAPVSAYVGHDVGGLLKRAPIGDGVDDDVAVHVAEFAPNVRLLRAREQQIDKTCPPTNFALPGTHPRSVAYATRVQRVRGCRSSSLHCELLVTLKMHDLKMTDKILANCEHNYACIFDVYLANYRKIRHFSN